MTKRGNYTVVFCYSGNPREISSMLYEDVPGTAAVEKLHMQNCPGSIILSINEGTGNQIIEQSKVLSVIVSLSTLILGNMTSLRASRLKKADIDNLVDAGFIAKHIDNPDSFDITPAGEVIFTNVREELETFFGTSEAGSEDEEVSLDAPGPIDEIDEHGHVHGTAVTGDVVSPVPEEDAPVAEVVNEQSAEDNRPALGRGPLLGRMRDPFGRTKSTVAVIRNNWSR